MKKRTSLFLTAAFTTFLFSCEKDIKQTKCYQVKYISNYCTEQGSVLVSFGTTNTDATPIKDNDGKIIEYQAALINVSESYRIQNKIFYVKYHYNSNDNIEIKSCPQGPAAVKVLTVDAVSNDDCNVN
ncbi:hypothetical protein [Pedobacter punctiformis]|uniref:Uncharacterized protein n=1 Tax=Pedobacter punctiformis TaxID=3004097 RepID=A0ABT4L909_9SPHI|nr:hypothetical protein [Pedobacter sp. HCMS5-2]MCZ4244375.1 hypothetical protein [Pedobacter sp. HCMS5-2]